MQGKAVGKQRFTEREVGRGGVTESGGSREGRGVIHVVLCWTARLGLAGWLE